MVVVTRDDRLAGARPHVQPMSMSAASKMCGSHLPEAQKSRVHLPQTNWLKHANAFECIPSSNNFLSSSMLYSLESQKPSTSRETASRLGVLLQISQ